MKNKRVALLVFGLIMFCIMGMSQVKALTNSFNIVCLPEALEIGGRANCYIIANLNDNNAIYGVYSRAITRDLTIKKVGTNQTGVDSGLFYAGQKSGKNNNGLFDCNSALGFEIKNKEGKTAKELGYKDQKQCAYFESSSTEPKIAKGFKSTELSKGFTNGGNAYSEIGYYEVELDSTATANNCGTICVAVWYAEKATDNPNNVKGSGNESQAKTYYPAGMVCSDITPTVKPTDKPDTGNFASYAVLIAGACIAIAAIAIASKNNKLYKV